MRPRILLTTLVACASLLALPAASAHANAADDRIVQDCENSATGALSGSYSKAQLNHALHNLPSDASEYTGCYDAIRQALLAAADGGPGGGGDAGGGSGTTGGLGAGAGGIDGGASAAKAGGGGSPGAVANAKPPAGAERPVEVAGVAVAPGTLPEIGRDSHRLPTALIVLLVLLGVAALVPAGLTIGRRVVARRRA